MLYATDKFKILCLFQLYVMTYTYGKDEHFVDKSDTSSMSETTSSSDFTYATNLTDNTTSSIISWSTSCCASEIAEKLYGLRYSRGRFRCFAWIFGFTALILAIYGNFDCSFSSKIASDEVLIGVWGTSHPGETCFAYDNSAHIDNYMIVARIGSLLAIISGSLGLSLLWFSIFLTLRMIRLTCFILALSAFW